MSPLKPNYLRLFRRWQRNIICKLALRSRACSRLLRAATPIRLQSYRCAPSPASRLMVFLPGIGDVLEDYEFHGFVEGARQHGVTADMIAADMHFGYYVRQIAVERLRQDVIIPARDQGYRDIDLVGISLGGFGALIYAMHYPIEVARLFLLAPYLGDRILVEEIAQAGGARKWRPRAVADNYQRRLWLWLKDYAAGSGDFPDLYLGYGLQDKFAAANQLLAELLPPPHLCTIPGKHDWMTWSRLWNLLLARTAGDFSNARAHPAAVSKEP